MTQLHENEENKNNTDWSSIRSSITAKVFKMIFDVKAETEKNVVPQKHLHSTARDTSLQIIFITTTATTTTTSGSLA